MSTIVGVCEWDAEIHAYNLTQLSDQRALLHYFRYLQFGEFAYRDGFWYFNDGEFKRVKVERTREDDVVEVKLLSENDDVLFSFAYVEVA